jgi:NAD(P)-dependent dehydrogenase (short-subunit alcohol dehydrogenase family)
MAGVEGRVTLITGAGRGIGKIAVEILAARGAKVMAVSRSEDELAALGVDHAVADLGTPEGCAHAVEETVTRLGPVDVLVCNHGIGSAHEKLIWEQDPEVWDETMRINLDGPFHLTRLLMAGMVERNYGRLVYTASTAASVAERAGSAYNASKAGLVGLMKSAAQDGGPHSITSNAVLPGWVRTEMAERSAAAEAVQRDVSVEEVWKERNAMYLPDRVVEPREVAEMIAFLASEESSGVSGEAIKVALGNED